MAASSAEYYEVRWRLQGSDEAWSNPQRVSPVGEIVVSELERDKSYDFEVRAVSNCGAKSVWVSGAHDVPTTPAGTLTLAELLAEASQASEDAAAATAALAAIASDGVLSVGEKPRVIRDWSVIIGERDGIEAQAAAFGVIAENTTYDAAVIAAGNYLDGLTTPTTWDDLSGNTNIDGPTFRAKFANVYTSRQALLNAIYAAAKVKADTAKASADAAQTTAMVAQSNASITDPNFVQGINNWSVDFFPGGWYGEAGGVSPSPVITTYAVHAGSTNAVNTNHISTTALRNTGFGSVKPGQVISASALVRPTGGPDGSADVRISWRNASQAEIRVDHGNAVTNATGTGMSRVTGTAPAGAAYAHIEVAAYSHTVGFYTYTGCNWTYQPVSLDEVPNSATYLKSLARTQGLVENGDFEIGDATTFPPAGWKLGGAVLGASVTSPGYDISTAYSGTRALYFTALQFSGYESTRMYPVTPGDYYAIGGALAGTGATFTLYFLNAANGVTGNIQLTAAGYSTATGKVPPGSVSAVLALGNFASGTHLVEFDALFLARCSSYDNALAIAGSGQRLGDMRNQVMVGVGNYASGWSGGSISYTSTSTSATITAAAASLQMGASSLAYGASSVTVSGSAGATVTYYLYYDDATYAGGSRTLNATTSQITSLAADGRLLVGSIAVTYPTSGTGGGGGSTGCPQVDEPVIRRAADGSEEVIRAGEVRNNDHLLLSSGRWGRVTYSERKLQPGVRVTGADGSSITCSASAPLETASGPCVPAPEVGGLVLRHRAAGVMRAVDVIDVGDIWVQHITCENDCFWVGNYSHHNLKPPIP